MSQGVTYLHSHSGIERERRLPKRYVLVDEKYKGLFEECSVVMPFVHNNRLYYQVPTIAFYHKGGVFKNFDS